MSFAELVVTEVFDRPTTYEYDLLMQDLPEVLVLRRLLFQIGVTAIR